MQEPYYSPTGTARRRFRQIQEGEAKRPAAPAESFLEQWAASKEGQDLGPAIAYLAWEAASLDNSLSETDRETFAHLTALSLLNGLRGSTRLPIPVPKELLIAGDEKTAADMGERIRALLARPPETLVGTEAAAFRPFLYLGGYFYHQRVLLQESRLIAAIRRKLAQTVSQPDTSSLEAALQTAEAAPGIALTEEQRTAVRAAVTAPCTVISGGPGTGKTTIVRAILQVLHSLGTDPRSVALAAPTGRAAFRLGASLRQEGVAPPETLHRLLGYAPSGDRFRRHENNPLAADTVIVDEASMIDLRMMAQLFRALRDEARLILLGDADQLPSVDTGAVLRDLLPDDSGAHALAAYSVRLTESHRMRIGDPAGAAVFHLAAAVRDGDGDALFPLLHRPASAEALRFAGVEQLPPEQRGAFLSRWHEEKIGGLPDYDAYLKRVYAHDEAFAPEDKEALDRLFAHMDGFRLLCATRVFDTGAEQLNLAVRALAAGRRGGANWPEAGGFFVGEPVLMQRNDYERRLFNGDQGLVLLVGTPDGTQRPMAVFPREGGYAPFHLEALRGRLRLAYAGTVHKSQGSEFDAVALVLPDEDMPLMSRELLYTAVTRARKSVVLLGGDAVLRKTLGRRIQRFTGIRDWARGD